MNMIKQIALKSLCNHIPPYQSKNITPQDTNKVVRCIIEIGWRRTNIDRYCRRNLQSVMLRMLRYKSQMLQMKLSGVMLLVLRKGYKLKMSTLREVMLHLWKSDELPINVMIDLLNEHI